MVIGVCQKYKCISALFLYIVCTGIFQQAYASEATISLTSDPLGASICERISKGLSCFSHTPASFSTNFRSEISSKRYYFRKLGYEPTSLIIKFSNPNGHVTLKKQSINPNPNVHTNKSMQNLQRTTNNVVEKLIYGGALGLPRYTFLGDIRPIVISDKTYIKVEVLLDDFFRKTVLNRLNRIKNQNKRVSKIAIEILKMDVGSLILQLNRHLAGIGDIQGIMLVAKYSEYKLIPVEDDTTYTHIYRQYQGQTVRDGHVYDNYLVTSRVLTTGYTNLKKETQLNSMIMYIPRNAKLQGSESYEELISSSIIFSDDSRDGQLFQLN